MRILFRYMSCSAPSLGCVDANEIGFDADDGVLWFSCGDRIWYVECVESVANVCIRAALHSGYVDVSPLVFSLAE